MGLNDQLYNQIDSYLKRNKHASFNSLAKKSKVGASTIRRIHSKTLKGDPSPHTVLNLASALTNETNFNKLISMFDGELGDYLKEAFSLYSQTATTHAYKHELNEVLKDQMSYMAYKMAANRTGVSKFTLVEEFGNLGLARMQKLRDLGFVFEEEGIFHATEKNFSVDYKVASAHLPDLVKSYRPEELEKGRNIFYTLSETINEDGIKQIKDIQREAVEKIYAVLNSPYYEGDLHYFTLNLADTLTHSSKKVYQ
ncbi:hypothetical protein A9Q84_15520 [Halobacteriovorax marinus]|uniref:HTH cro/C1-type domain-containing protein n=1 Tax=Halobacteriovorax marinus TaxID=97084 RepID=A0A1Y5F9M1_9BACT|nr:hypothetical protein A9Q84_15520 [Halobacteriovorax marinus]